MRKINPKYKKLVRLGIGFLILCLGGVFMLFPFIPLGYIFVFAGLFLLAFEIRPLKKLVNRMKKNDKKGRIEKVEQKIEKGDQFISENFIQKENDNSEKK